MDCYKGNIILPQDIEGYMVKIRKLASLEKGLEEITRILTEEEIKKAINKGSSYIRKCSDPDPDSDGIKRNIDHKDSVELDKACIKKGKGHPLLTSHEYMIAHELEKFEGNEDNDIDEMLVRSTILHGKLTEVVKQSEDPKSDSGKKISPLEKKEIMKAIKNVEDKILKIKLTIDSKK